MSVSVDATGVRDETPDTGGLGGHPRGLTTLFFTEMWERFSFYGLKALLVLYMTKSVAEGGLNFSESYSGLIAATYFSSVYWTPLIGGWLADKIFGARRAVLIGGIIIALGHLSMFFHTLPNFYAGLILIAAGTGMLKPNVSTMVGGLYSEEDKRRDAGFSIFYMGINLGAFIAPLVCGPLGQKIDWHYGFAAAFVGMTLGIIQYVLGGKRLSRVGNPPLRKREPDIKATKAAPEETRDVDVVTIALAVVLGVVGFGIGYYTGGRGGTGVLSGLFPGVAGFFAGYLLGV
ncbi:MAG: peptide MFS transporter, partial [Acidobacteria bacterium]|nr:peptide MFS transporter [Acidobacteriota bacterium]